MQQVAFNMPPRKAPPFQYAYPQRSNDDAQARNFPRSFTGEGHTDQTSLTAYRTKPCRYHQAGFCRAGEACPFLHTPQDQDVRTREALSHSSRLQPSVRARPSIAIPPVQYPVFTGYPYTQTWSPHTGLSAQPQAQSQGNFQLGVPPNVGPAAYMPFDPSAYYYYSNPSVSPNSAIDELTTPLDESRLVAEPPLGHPPYPLFAPTSNLFYRQPNAPPSNYQADHFGYPTARASGRTNQQRSVTAPLSRKRIASYKTKPCKFWGRDGTCPNGPQCTFLHDEIASEQLDSTEASSSSSVGRSGQPPAELPRKPLSVIEEKKSQGIYPISWRVIGGGVMMGGSREICRAFTAGQCNRGDECAFAHEVEYDSIGHYTPVATVPVPDAYTHLQVPRSMAQARTQEPPQRQATRAAKPPSISIPPPADFLPTSSSAGTSYSAQVTALPSLDEMDRKSPSSHRRTRSMTTPPVSGSPVNLFPAESPGVL